MRKCTILSLLLAAILCDGATAAVARRGARTNTGTAQTTTQQTDQKPTTAARAATNSRTAPRATSGGRTTAARAAKPTTAAPSAPQKTVAARAGTTQKMINTGTSVATAAKNVLVDHTCQEKYNGCMDSFCMLNNANGGRCVCSDRNAELNSALAEIEKIDELSYQMATMGVEQLEMGMDADAAISMSKNVVDSLKEGKKNLTKSDDKSVKSRGLSFDAWDANTPTEQNIFAGSSQSTNVTDKTGDELYNSAMKLCAEQIPECKDSLESVQLLYAQQIKSDCLAFENTIKKRRAESNEKLQAAERALRDTALEQEQIQNKYDLGQCTAKFKECMQTTAGCGDDFSQCTTVAVETNTNSRKIGTGATKKHKIEGTVYHIEIFAATYEALLGKKPMCEHVTKQCVDVADQVWDAFIHDSAAQIKAGETIAENNMRQNCAADISSCFQKACKDNIDPSDPDGSYDMCLSRPETMLNVCKVPLNNCGIDTTRKGTAQKSDIWQFILARLASVRVNECTKQIKQCLSANDRCGPDYTNCIGLDMDTIVGMCPLDKLTACDSSEYGNSASEKEAYIYDVAQGVLLNVDNQLLQACQNAINTKMMEICGSTTTCMLSDINSELGRGSLQTTQDDHGNYIISGTIDFNKFTLTHPENPASQYTVSYNGNRGNYASRIDALVSDINNEVNRKISMLTMDPTVNMCITGRNISQIVKGRTRDQQTAARLPKILVPYVNTIYDSLLTIARSNYTRDFAIELSNANSMSREYRNILMCASMAELEDSKIPDNVGTQYGIIESNDEYVKLSGTTVQAQMDALSKNTSRTIPICTGARAADGKSCAGGDSFMIATEERTAVYEPGPQACRITSRLYACIGYEAIYEGETSSYNVDMGANATLGAGLPIGKPKTAADGTTTQKKLGADVGVGGSLGFGGSKSKTTHKETFCNSFAEPTVSEQVISFSSGNPIYSEVFRGNEQNVYRDSSITTNINDSSWGVNVGLDLTTGKGTTGAPTTVNANGGNVDLSQHQIDSSSGITVNKTQSTPKYGFGLR